MEVRPIRRDRDHQAVLAKIGTVLGLSGDRKATPAVLHGTF